MRGLWEATLFAALVCPNALQAAEAKAGTCEAAVGAMEFTSQPGRAVIAKAGSKYQIVYVATSTNPATKATEPLGGASECTCDGSAGKLLWNCRVLFSLQPAQIGSQEKYEWAVDGENVKSWPIGPDGKRGEVVTVRYVK